MQRKAKTGTPGSRLTILSAPGIVVRKDSIYRGLRLKQVGYFTQAVIDALHLPVLSGTPIMLDETNIGHMKKRHPADYKAYGCDIELILSDPDYVGQNPTDSSIEYVKEYHIDGKFMKVSVRISAKGTHFARSIYVLNNSRVINFIAKGTLIKIADSK